MHFYQVIQFELKSAVFFNELTVFTWKNTSDEQTYR